MGPKRDRHKKTIFVGSLCSTQERRNEQTPTNNTRIRAVRFKALGKYIKVNKEVKKRIVADVWEYVVVLSSTSEKAEGGNVKELFGTNRRLVRQYSKARKSVRKKGNQSLKFKNM